MFNKPLAFFRKFFPTKPHKVTPKKEARNAPPAKTGAQLDRELQLEKKRQRERRVWFAAARRSRLAVQRWRAKKRMGLISQREQRT